ncbi:serine hydrolase [Dinghuibacter silviterrae]|uniref:CubicO group peptidase (Beta-lactamase class C family) n=1 Tax=Dinghuibacter silviterrae TaxID=1539049 RepID=A0A4V3GLW2_9BACT|nr:serine hydrolase [Dinghuibacter silviterrae]TDX01143.1 CubicO group peptidase (beta-lactamase class C family) [Dinghuibacter silviterrae]
MLRRSLYAVLLAAPLCARAQTPAFISDSLDAYIHRGMQDWQIPGMAVLILKDGQPVVMKGYGTRELGKDEPVDEHTLFFIASNTKLFTGTAIAALDEEKKLSLTDPVTKYMPGFRLYDTTATRLLDVRDLLSHHLGTKTFQGDFSFWNSNLSREAIIAKMRLLQPPGQFRQDYGYCNSCFLTAGELIPKVTGERWEDFIQQRFLDKLGMTHTHTSTEGAASYPDMAHPYTSFFGDPVALPFDHIDNLGPAGSLVSCISDLSHWLQMQLDSGRYGGQQVFSWDVIRKTRMGGTIVRTVKSSVLPMHFALYGLGVLTADYNGRQVFWHTGGAFGFVTNTCFVPEEHLAIAILTNNDDQGFFEALRYQILDAYVGVPYTDRSAQFLEGARTDKAKRLKELDDWKAQVRAGARPALPLEAFAGSYSNALYGKIRITVRGKGLLVRFEHHPDLSATLDYMGGDKFLMTYSNPAYGIFPTPFTIKGGKVKSVTVKASDFVEYDPYVFVKD